MHPNTPSPQKLIKQTMASLFMEAECQVVIFYLKLWNRTLILPTLIYKYKYFIGTNIIAIIGKCPIYE